MSTPADNPHSIRDHVPKSSLDHERERLAALGEVTAGVAHEIKNPLNFIVNFADVSLDLVDQAVSTLAPALACLDEETRAEVNDLLGLVRQNCVKINEHGRRADSIVRTMLMHARQCADKTQTASLNALAEEALNLARQDLKLTSSERPVRLSSSLSPDVGAIECFPEDLLRALINLIGNAIDAAQRHEDRAAPMVNVMTKAIEGQVEISIEDNGAGMPRHVLDQAMTPFFTTKPPGEGTGLGLSLSHDVISRQHRGQLTIESEPGAFTRAKVTLHKHLPDRRTKGRRREDG